MPWFGFIKVFLIVTLNFLIAIMKVSIVCLVLMAAIVLVAARPDEPVYTTKFDNINVDEILHSDRLLNNYFKCLMDEGRCTAEGNELKRTYNKILFIYKEK